MAREGQGSTTRHERPTSTPERRSAPPSDRSSAPPSDRSCSDGGSQSGYSGYSSPGRGVQPISPASAPPATANPIPVQQAAVQEWPAVPRNAPNSDTQDAVTDTAMIATVFPSPGDAYGERCHSRASSGISSADASQNSHGPPSRPRNTDAPTSQPNGAA